MNLTQGKQDQSGDTGKGFMSNMNLTPQTQKSLIKGGKIALTAYIAFAAVVLVLVVSVFAFVAYNFIDMRLDSNEAREQMQQNREEFLNDYNETERKIEEHGQEMEAWEAEFNAEFEETQRQIDESRAQLEQ